MEGHRNPLGHYPFEATWKVPGIRQYRLFGRDFFGRPGGRNDRGLVRVEMVFWDSDASYPCLVVGCDFSTPFASARVVLVDHEGKAQTG
jgi:hypothetical protein